MHCAFTIGDIETPVGTLTVTRRAQPTRSLCLLQILLWGKRRIPYGYRYSGGKPDRYHDNYDHSGRWHATTSINFNVNVTPVNDPPTISAITDRTINEDSQTGNITLQLVIPKLLPAHYSYRSHPATRPLCQMRILCLVEPGYQNSQYYSRC